MARRPLARTHLRQARSCVYLPASPYVQHTLSATGAAPGQTGPESVLDEPPKGRGLEFALEARDPTLILHLEFFDPTTRKSATSAQETERMSVNKAKHGGDSNKENQKCVVCGKTEAVSAGMCELCNHIADEWHEQSIDLEFG